MAKLFNKVLNFVGWESEDEYEDEQEEAMDEYQQPPFLQSNQKKQSGKVVNIHQANQLKVVIVQPENFEDAKDICDHIKDKKPVVVNLEDVEKESAQRIVDFLSGSIYALDGGIQKVANGIFLIAPNNVDIAGDFKDEMRNRTSFPWVK